MTPTPDPLRCTFCRHEIRCSVQPAPALDVERLARAEHKRNLSGGDERCYHSTYSGNDCERIARFLAREYAALAEPQPAPALDAHRELAARFWIHYRCGMVGCEIVEQHEHGGGQPMREMTPDELAARES